MSDTGTRRLLYLETFLLTFAVGGFLTLPLQLKSMGRTEVFFAQVYAAGAIGAITCVLATPWLLRRLGLSRLAPWGSLSFLAGSLLYALAVHYRLSDGFYYLASLVQGVGWGLFLTQGPICLSTTVTANTRAYFFTIYGAYNTLGLGLAPILSHWLFARLNVAHGEFYFVSCAAASFAFIASARAAFDNAGYRASAGGTSAAGDASTHPRIREVWRYPSVYFVGMVFMCACIFTSMMNFQATFANAYGIDYTVFYGFYSLAVVLSRFFLSKPLGLVPVCRSVPGLAGLMLLAIAAMFFAESSIVCYAGGALLLGISYGLLYPTIQAQAANGVPGSLRAQALILFSLSYMVARYLFPYVGAKMVLVAGYDGLLTALTVCALLNLAIAIYYFTARAKRVSPMDERLEKVGA
jgi:MFS family permease